MKCCTMEHLGTRLVGTLKQTFIGSKWGSCAMMQTHRELAHASSMLGLTQHDLDGLEY